MTLFNKDLVVIFVNQKEVYTLISKQFHVSTRSAMFLGYGIKPAKNWFIYPFHINGDKNREIKLAVKLFHLTT